MASEEECIAALRRAADELGESPTKAQYEDLGYTPAHGTIQRILGSWNEAKEAAGLETYKVGGSRQGSGIQPKPDWVDLPEDEEWDELSSHQRWYRKNRDRQAGKKTRRRQRLRRWLDGYKRNECECTRCGEDHPACLDFHHVDEKEVGVAEMVNRAFSRDAILDEISKSEVLCANCHRREHYDLPGPVDNQDS